MNLKKYRPSFLCSFVGTGAALDSIRENVEKKKYQSLSYETGDDLFSDALQNPPHFVCWYMEHYNESTFKSWMERFLKELPETRVFLVADKDVSERIHDLEPKPVYSVITFAKGLGQRVLAELDHAAENLVYMYLNEQLTERLSEMEKGAIQEMERLNADTSMPEMSLDMAEPVALQSYFELQESLLTQLSVNSSVEAFLTHIEKSLPEQGGAVYFKYNSPRKTLVASYGLGVDPALIEGIGLNFERVDPDFQRSQIRQVHERESFQNLLSDVFQVSDCVTRYLTVSGDVIGVFVYWGLKDGSPERKFLERAFQLLNKQCQHLDLEKRIHTVDVTDETSVALKKHKFFQRMNEEVARARRTSLPLAFVLMSVDRYKIYEEASDKSDISLFIKSLAQIIDKHSRVNDILGRVSRSEFGLLLPHTSVRGGVVKAERLRRMIESANFRKVLGTEETVTLSLAVSEYPSNCRDADELFQTADQVLFDQGKELSNKVVVAKPPDGFIADFLVQEVRDSRLVR